MHKERERDIEDVTKVVAPLVERLTEVSFRKNFNAREMLDVYHLHIQLAPNMFFGMRDQKEREYIAHYLSQSVKQQVMTLTFVEPRRDY